MDKISIKNRIDKNIFTCIKSEVEVKNLIPSLTYNRFDLAFKLLFLDALIYKRSDDYLEMYEEHIRAFSLGSYTEPGQEKEKNSIDKYKEIFRILYTDIKENGFDEEKSLIPLAEDGSILNGAHRTSISLFLNKDVSVVQTQLPASLYDFKFFYNRNVPISILEKAAVKFVETSLNTYVAFIWPTAKRNNLNLGEFFPNIVYQKELKLNNNGAHNLLSQIYEGESWLGSVENNFRGVTAKLVECFKTFDPLQVVAFQAESLYEVLKIKENVRTTFNVGKHSIHITDTHEEAIRTARCVFNDNGIHFLNNAKPNQYLSFHQKIKMFKSFIRDNGADQLDFVLDSSIILEAYGLRKAKDIDYLSCSINVLNEIENINSHDDELVYHGGEKEEFVYNSDNYFYFQDLKFLSFFNLYKFKKERNEGKDINDCLMMEALVENNKFKTILASFKQTILYKKNWCIYKTAIFLKKIHLYKQVKLIYNLFK